MLVQAMWPVACRRGTFCSASSHCWFCSAVSLSVSIAAVRQSQEKQIKMQKFCLSFHLKHFLFHCLLSSLEPYVFFKMKGSELPLQGGKEDGSSHLARGWSSLYRAGSDVSGATWRIVVSKFEAPRAQVRHPKDFGLPLPKTLFPQLDFQASLNSIAPTLHWMTSLRDPSKASNSTSLKLNLLSLTISNWFTCPRLHPLCIPQVFPPLHPHNAPYFPLHCPSPGLQLSNNPTSDSPALLSSCCQNQLPKAKFRSCHSPSAISHKRTKFKFLFAIKSPYHRPPSTSPNSPQSLQTPEIIGLPHLEFPPLGLCRNKLPFLLASWILSSSHEENKISRL